MRLTTKVLTAICVLFLLPLAVHAAIYATQDHPNFRDANWSSTGMLPAASADKEARLLVFAGRTGRWRGVFSVHSWIVFKPENATTWSRYDVVGWGRPVRLNGWAPDSLWFGHAPRVLVDVRGKEAAALIPKVKAAIADYRYNEYGDRGAGTLNTRFRTAGSAQGLQRSEGQRRRGFRAAAP